MRRQLLAAAFAACAAMPSFAYDVNQPGGGYVVHLFQTILGRAPAEDGFAYWVGRFQSGAVTLEGIRDVLQGTSEAGTYAASKEIAQYYRDLQDREPEASGLAYWTGQYASGALTLANIRATIASNYSSDAINSVYRQILHRDANPAEMSFYTSELASGKTLTDMRYGLFYSAENYTYHAESLQAVCEEIGGYAGGASDAGPTLQACINQTASGGTLAIPAGKYTIRTQIAITRPVTIRTQFKTDEYPKCAAGDNHDCAELRASSDFADRYGIIQIQGAPDTALDVTLDHIVVNGNKDARQNSVAAAACHGGVDNSYGYNVLAGAHNVTVTNSVFKNALCGSGFMFGWGNSFVFRKNTVASNGYHGDNLWADGLTAIQPAYSHITDNEFIDNTDVDLVLGQCVTCTVQGNAITHSDSFAGSSFAALMLHAWPGYPAVAGSSSGDYTGADVSGNFIDCGGAAHRCGYGLYLGASAWYVSDSHGGSVHDNVINGAQQGVSLDAFRQVVFYNNYATESGGTFWVQCPFEDENGRTIHPMDLTAYNLSPATLALPPSDRPDLSQDTVAMTTTYANHRDCIPNQWQHPY